MKTTFSYFPGMFEITAPGKIIQKIQDQKYYEILIPTFGVDTFSELGSFQLLNNDDKNCIQNSAVN